MHKPNEIFRLLAHCIANDLHHLATETEFDARLHHGGLFYAAAADFQQHKTQYVVPLVLRSTLPPSHPKSRVITTNFTYHITLHGHNEHDCHITQRPVLDDLRIFFNQHVHA